MAVSKIDAYHQSLIDSQKPAARFFVPGRRGGNEEAAEDSQAEESQDEESQDSEDSEVDAKVVAPPRRRTARATTDDAEAK